MTYDFCCIGKCCGLWSFRTVTVVLIAGTGVGGATIADKIIFKGAVATGSVLPALDNLRQGQ
jgi:hypothetical protein